MTSRSHLSRQRKQSDIRVRRRPQENRATCVHHVRSVQHEHCQTLRQSTYFTGTRTVLTLPHSTTTRAQNTASRPGSVHTVACRTYTGVLQDVHKMRSVRERSAVTGGGTRKAVSMTDTVSGHKHTPCCRCTVPCLLRTTTPPARTHHGAGQDTRFIS